MAVYRFSVYHRLARALSCSLSLFCSCYFRPSRQLHNSLSACFTISSLMFLISIAPTRFFSTKANMFDVHFTFSHSLVLASTSLINAFSKSSRVEMPGGKANLIACFSSPLSLSPFPLLTSNVSLMDPPLSSFLSYFLYILDYGKFGLLDFIGSCLVDSQILKLYVFTFSIFLYALIRSQCICCLEGSL